MNQGLVLLDEKENLRNSCEYWRKLANISENRNKKIESLINLGKALLNKAFDR